MRADACMRARVCLRAVSTLPLHWGLSGNGPDSKRDRPGRIGLSGNGPNSKRDRPGRIGLSGEGMRTARVLADDSASPTYSKNVLRRPMHAKVPTQAGPATAQMRVGVSPAPAQMRVGVSPAPAQMCADAIVATVARLLDGPEAVGGRDREVVHADARCEVRVEPHLQRRNTERCKDATLRQCNGATMQHGTVQRCRACNMRSAAAALGAKLCSFSPSPEP